MEPFPDYFLKWKQAEADIERLREQVDYLQKDNARLFFLLNPKPEEDPND